MDSNFQVKITADLGDLAAKIKNIEATLAKLDSTFKATSAKASSSFSGVGSTVASVGVDMNRARLATFAFGQVIRDAGFFSQSFGLGLLAISNNVPILIDQLVMLSGVSAGVGAAISLMGSLLTAALTIWAYSSMSVNKNSEALAKNKNILDSVKLSGDEYYKTLNILNQAKLKGNTSAQSELTTLKLLYSQYQNSELSLQKRKEAYQQIQQLYPEYFKNVAFEQEASTKTEGLYNKLTTSILATARARAASDLITKNSIRQLEDEQKILDLSIELSKAKSYADKQRAISIASIGAAGQEGTGSITATNNEIKALKNVEEIRSKINNLKTDSNILTTRNLQLEKSVTEEIKKGGKITDETVKGDGGKSKLEKIRDVYKELSNELKKIQYDTLSSDLEKANATFDVHKKALQSLLDNAVNPLSDGYKKIETALLSAMRAVNDLEGKRFAGNLEILKIKYKSAELTEREADAKKKQLDTEKELSKLGEESTAGKLIEDPLITKQNEGFLNLIANIAKTKESLMDMGNILVGPLANAFENMMQTGNFGFKEIIKSLGQVVLKLIAAVAAAAILAAILSALSGGTLGGKKALSFSGAFSGLMSGKGMFPGLKPRAKGGIFSGPSAALVGEYPGAKNNPEVIAPLDKLKSLIGDSGGGQMVGQLEARISGNDLVILMDRASKNRKGYY